MNKHESAKISALMSVLVNEPLRSISRTATAAYLGFGDLVDVPERILNNKNKSGIPEKPSRYALHIQTAFRFKCGNKIILGQADIFQPNARDFSNPDFDWSSYDYDISGNNHFDELSPQFSFGNDKGFVVKSVSVNNIGDLSITFQNNYKLEVFTDVFGPVECWRFFDFSADAGDIAVSNSGLLKVRGAEPDTP